MPMHAIAYSESLDAGGVPSLIAAVPDPSVRTDGDNVVVPQEVNRIIGAIACIGTTAERAVLLSPSLRRTNPYEIYPVVPLLVPNAPFPAVLHPASPVPLDYNESLNAQITADPSGAERNTVGVFLADAPPNPVSGAIKHVRFSVNLALVAGVWVNATIDFVDELPTGVYQVVGSAITVPTAVLARWYPVGGKWRPGFPVLQSVGQQGDPRWRNGQLGQWFSFDQVQPPTIDILSSAGAGAATYYGVLDVIPA